MSTQYQQVIQAAAYIRERTSLVPKVVLVLGSGLGDYADRMQQAQVISYEQIPGFPISTVKEHKAKLILGTLFEVPVAIMQGRYHYYEGYTAPEIGTILHKNPNTVYTLLTRARDELRKMLGGEDFE